MRARATCDVSHGPAKARSECGETLIFAAAGPMASREGREGERLLLPSCALGLLTCLEHKQAARSSHWFGENFSFRQGCFVAHLIFCKSQMDQT